MSNYGSVPVAVASIGAQLESILWNTTEGIKVGIQALVGQNYGAGLYERVVEIIKTSFKLVSDIGFVAMSVLFIFRFRLFHLFTPTDIKAIELGEDYLLIFSVLQLLMAVEIGLAGAYNGLSETKTPAAIGEVSMNLLKIPLVLVLMTFLGVHGVWVAMSTSYNLKGLLSMIFLRKKVRKLKDGTYKKASL